MHVVKESSWLMALPQVPRPLPWLWWAGLFGVNAVYNFTFFAAISSGLGFPFPSIGQSEPEYWLARMLLILLGLVLSLSSLFLIARGYQRTGRRMAVVISALLILQQSGIGCQSKTETSFFEVRYFLDSCLAYLQSTPLLNSIAWIQSTYSIHWNILGLHGVVKPGAWQIIPILIMQPVIIFAHYWLIRWAITGSWKPTTGSRDSPEPQ